MTTFRTDVRIWGIQISPTKCLSIPSRNSATVHTALFNWLLMKKFHILLERIKYYSKLLKTGLQIFLISFILGILLLSFTAVLEHPLILEVT